jgi:hypothetical protein
MVTGLRQHRTWIDSAYAPDTPSVWRSLARYYDCIQVMDPQVPIGSKPEIPVHHKLSPAFIVDAARAFNDTGWDFWVIQGFDPTRINLPAGK